MVLDYPGYGYQQQSYAAAQGGYSYPQAGYPYSTPPMGTGYNSMGYGNSNGYGHGHQYNGMTNYSAGTMGFGANPCPPVGHGYGPTYTAVKYDNVYSAYKEVDD